MPNAPFLGKRQVHLAGTFFVVAFLFFLASLGVAGYFFYFGSNTVSVDKVAVEVQGPTTIAGGDTVPLTLTITNKNSVAIENATIEVNFPNGTRSATDVLSAYPRYSENLGTIASGATVTRSVKVIMFGGAGEELSLPASLSYGVAASNAIFVKKIPYALAISSAPLSVSIEAPPEVISGKPFTLALTVRSSAAVPLDNVVLAAAFPFGFSAVSSSIPLNNSSFLIGTLAPGASKSITLTGTLLGQDTDTRIFHVTVGTAKSPQDQTLAVTYMTQDATVAIAAPFIATTLALNGTTSSNPVIQAKGYQTVTVSYANTLPLSIENATVAVAISGSAIDYDSIRTANGFYRSADHTVIFSKDTDRSLATLAPGASGTGTFTFSTLAPESLPPSPTVTFTTSVSGTRAGQTSVTEAVNTSATKTAKVATTIVLASSALRSSGTLRASGPIPPRVNQATAYAIVWNVRNEGNAIADGSVSATLPGYVSYTGKTSGPGSFSYDQGSRVLTWTVGNLAQDTSAQGAFQVSFVPSSSQKGTMPTIAGTASFSGYDRFAGVQVAATAAAVTTETKNEPGYAPEDAVVQ